jgi:hypothetical protein
MYFAVKIAGPSIVFALLVAASDGAGAQIVSQAESGQKGQTFSRPPMQLETPRSLALSRYCVTPNNGWCDLAGAAVGSPCECADDNGKRYGGNAR